MVNWILSKMLLIIVCVFPMSELLIRTELSAKYRIQMFGYILGSAMSSRGCIAGSPRNPDVSDPTDGPVIFSKIFSSNVKYVHKLKSVSSRVNDVSNGLSGWTLCRSSSSIFLASFKLIGVKSAVKSNDSIGSSSLTLMSLILPKNCWALFMERFDFPTSSFSRPSGSLAKRNSRQGNKWSQWNAFLVHVG